MSKVQRKKSETVSEGSSALRPSFLPNFRRFIRTYPNTSDASKEDPVIKRFQVMMPSGFKEEVKLPSQFCRELGPNVPGDAILISYKGMWKVGFGRCRCHMDLVLGGDGWRSFIEHHDLKKQDLVWFEQTDLMVFRIHAFDLHANGEKFVPGNEQAEGGDGLIDHLFTGCNYGGGGLYGHNFTVNIEEHHLKGSSLTIPAEFLKRNGELKKKEWVILVNGRGNAWEVELCKPPQSQKHMRMRGGWVAFRESVKLMIGDLCTFSIDHHSSLTTRDTTVMRVCIFRTI